MSCFIPPRAFSLPGWHRCGLLQEAFLAPPAHSHNVVSSHLAQRAALTRRLPGGVSPLEAGGSLHL